MYALRQLVFVTSEISSRERRRQGNKNSAEVTNCDCLTCKKHLCDNKFLHRSYMLLINFRLHG